MTEPEISEENEPQPAATQTVHKNSLLTRWLIRLGLVFGFVIIALAGFCWYAYRAAQVVPDYYQAILEQPETQLDAAGDQFETELLELQNSAIELGSWRAAFSQDQINGWLGSDLPQKFPDALPPSISNPRISLRQDEMRIVFGYQSKQLNGIVECCGDIFCAEQVNQLAVRIKYIRSGVVTLPIANWTDEITKIFQTNGIVTQWVEDNGDPMLLVNLKDKIVTDLDLRVVVESVEFLKGEVVLQGVTMDPADGPAYEAARLSRPQNNSFDR